MPISLIIDLVFVLIGLGIVLRCWKLGFVAAVVRLVGTIAAYLGAWILSGPASRFLYDTFVHTYLVGYVAENIPTDLATLAGSASSLLESLPLEQVSEIVQALLEPMLDSLAIGGGLPLFAPDVGALSLNLVTLMQGGQTSLSEALVEALLRSGVTLIIQLICFSVIFGVISMAVGFLIGLAKGVNHLPLLGGLNHLLGGAVGIVEAVLVVYILCLALTILSGLLGSTVELLHWRSIGGSWAMQAAADLRLPGSFSLLP